MGLEIDENSTRVHVEIKNRNDHAVACNYVASLVAGGQQYDEGFPEFSSIAADAAISSFYEWSEPISQFGSRIRLIAKCWDDQRGRFGDSLDFDVAAKVRG